MKTIQKNNDLIADFMKVLFYDDEGEYYNSIDGLFLGSTLNYDTSWDWLMPVVEKITELGYLVLISEEGCDITFKKPSPSCICGVATYEEGSIERATYKAVVGFIEWYNENNK